jgi:hypothetical protein
MFNHSVKPGQNSGFGQNNAQAEQIKATRKSAGNQFQYWQKADERGAEIWNTAELASEN